MFGHDNNSFFKSAIRSKITLVFLLSIVIFFSLSLVQRYRNFSEYQDELRKIEGDIDQLKEEKVKLEDLLSLLSTDAATEEQARLKLGWIREGERAFIVSGDGSANGTFEEDMMESNLKLWFKYFFHN